MRRSTLSSAWRVRANRPARTFAYGDWPGVLRLRRVYAASVGRRWWMILLGLIVAIAIVVATQPGFRSHAPELLSWMAAYLVAGVLTYLPVVVIVVGILVLIALSVRRRQNRI